MCRWFREAVLPLDRELETALFHRLDAKRCAVCGALFTPGSNRAKYCPECAVQVKPSLLDARKGAEMFNSNPVMALMLPLLLERGR